MSKFRFQSVQNNSRAKESEPISERNTGLAEANTLVLLPGLAEAIGHEANALASVTETKLAMMVHQNSIRSEISPFKLNYINSGAERRGIF